MERVFNDLRWQSDWDGEDIGYEDINVVGVYTSQEHSVFVYINVEEGLVIDVVPFDD